MLGVCNYVQIMEESGRHEEAFDGIKHSITQLNPAHPCIRRHAQTASSDTRTCTHAQTQVRTSYRHADTSVNKTFCESINRHKQKGLSSAKASCNSLLKNTGPPACQWLPSLMNCAHSLACYKIVTWGAIRYRVPLKI